MSRMNNEKGLGMTDEEIIAELHKKIGLYQIGMASEIDKRERVIVEAKEIIRDLIFDLVAIDGEQAEGLESVKKAKQFFREMKENELSYARLPDMLSELLENKEA